MAFHSDFGILEKYSLTLIAKFPFAWLTPIACISQRYNSSLKFHALPITKNTHYFHARKESSSPMHNSKMSYLEMKGNRAYLGNNITHSDMLRILFLRHRLLFAI